MDKHQSQPKPDSGKNFKSSLARWGGWAKLITHNSEALVEPVSKTIENVGEHEKKMPPNIGKMPQNEWESIAEAFPWFLNAYLQQELNHIADGPHDIITILRLVDENLAGQILMALIIAAREHSMNVTVRCRSPYSEEYQDHECRLSGEKWRTTLTIIVAQEHGEVHIPLLLHYHGEERLLDQDESGPSKPVYKPILVDQKLAVFLDGPDYFDSTLQQRQRDQFLAQQGFLTARYCQRDIENDLFGRAAELIKLVSGKALPPPND